MQQILDFLTQNPTFYYATVDGDQPRVRPFGSFMEYEGKLYFGMGDHKESYRQTVANPNFEICTCDKHGQWIRIRGKAVFDERGEVMQAVLEKSPELRNIYNEKTGHRMANFYVTDGYCEITDQSGNFTSFNF